MPCTRPSSQGVAVSMSSTRARSSRATSRSRSDAWLARANGAADPRSGAGSFGGCGGGGVRTRPGSGYPGGLSTPPNGLRFCRLRSASLAAARDDQNDADHDGDAGKDGGDGDRGGEGESADRQRNHAGENQECPQNGAGSHGGKVSRAGTSPKQSGPSGTVPTGHFP